MHERGGKPADNFEPHPLPEADRAVVAAHYKIELHREKASLLCVFERMLTHRARNTAAAGPRRGHVSAIRYVRSPALLIGAQVIRAKNFVVLFRDEYFVGRRVPIC